MPTTFPASLASILSDVVLLNRSVYGGDDDMQPGFRGMAAAGDPSGAGIRSDLNVYDRYDLYLDPFGFDVLGAGDLVFDVQGFTDDLLPGSGNGDGLDHNWIYDGGLYRNHYQLQSDGSYVPFTDAGAVALVAVRSTDDGATLHLVFRGTDADLGSDGEAGTAQGQVRYYAQLEPLIDAVLAYVSDPANGITDVVVSGHSLGGSMADMFALYDAAAFNAVPGVSLQVVSLASAGIDPGTLGLRTDYDPALVAADGVSFVTPDWYAQYDNAQDIVRNPERYDNAAHLENDPQQAPLTRTFITALEEHISFEGGRLEVEMPLLDQYALSSSLQTTFLPQHYSSTYELVGLAAAEALAETDATGFDRVIALGGTNPNIVGTPASNNANAFGLPEDTAFDLGGETGALMVLGLSGDDTITTGSGDDLLGGGSGSDVLAPGMGDDTVVGGAGLRDEVSYRGASAGIEISLGAGTAVGMGSDSLVGIEFVATGSGADRFIGNFLGNRAFLGGGDDFAVGGAGRDVVFGQSGNDLLQGGLGDDLLDGGTGRDTLNGNAGDDSLLGRGDADLLRGGAGADTLDGGGNDDILIGGADADTFVYAPRWGRDTIRDFEDGTDMVDLTGFDFATGTTGADVIAAHGAQVGAHVVLDFGGAQQLTIWNTTLEALSDDLLI